MKITKGEKRILAKAYNTGYVLWQDVLEEYSSPQYGLSKIKRLVNLGFLKKTELKKWILAKESKNRTLIILEQKTLK